MKCEHCWRSARYVRGDLGMCELHFRKALYRGRVDYDEFHYIGKLEKVPAFREVAGT